MPLVIIKSDPRARLKPCLRCGYSLRNVPDARNCPECGLAVWITLSGNDELEMSNPAWLRRLTLATMALVAGDLALIAGVALVHLARVLPDLFRVTGPFLTLPNLAALPWLLAAHLALSGAGLVLIGASEGRSPERTRGLRRGTIAAGAIAILFAGWIAVWYLTRNTMPPQFLLVAVAFGQAVVGWLYLAGIARRIPSRRAQRLLRGLALVSGIAGVAAILNGRIWFYLWTIAPWSRPVIAWTFFLLLYPPAALWMLAYLTIAFRRAARAAEKNWRTESG